MKYKIAKKNSRNLKSIFEIQGIRSKKEGWEFYKWWSFFGKRKKYDPEYKYPKNKKM